MKRLSLSIAALLVLAPLIIALMAPGLVRNAIQGALLAQGAERVELDSIDIDWIAGRIDLRGLRAASADGTVLSLHTASADWAWHTLFSGRLNAVSASGLAVDVIHTDGQWSIRGLGTPAGSDIDGAHSQPVPPAIVIDRIRLDDARLDVSGVARPQRIQIHFAEINNLRLTEPEAVSRIYTDLSLAGGTLSLNGELQPALDERVFGGDLLVRSLQLDQLLGLSPGDPGLRLSGTLDTQRRITWTGEHLTTDGLTVLRQLTVGLDGLDSSADSVELTGRTLLTPASGHASLDSVLSVDGLKLTQDALTLSLARLDAELRASRDDELSLGGRADGNQLAMSLAESPQGPIKASVQAFSWRGETRLPGDDDAALSVDGELSLDKAALNTPTQAVSDDRIHWDGSLRQSSSGVLASGRLELARTRVKLPELDAGLSNTGWQGEFSAQDSGISAKGALKLAEADVTQPSLQAGLRSLDWQGEFAHAATATRLGSEQLVIGSSSVNLTGQDTQLQQQALHWSGELQVTDSTLSQLKGELQMGASRLAANGAELSLKRLALARVRTSESGSFEANDLQVDTVRLASDQHAAALLELGSAHLDHARVAIGQATELGSLKLSDAGILIIRNQSGDLLLPVPAGSPSKVVAEQPAAVPDDTDKPRWSIAGLELAGWNSLRFEDLSLSPPAKIELTDLRLSLGALASDQTAMDTPMSLHAVLGESGLIDLEGRLRPLQAQPDVDLRGRFRHLDLLAISHYLDDALGHRVTAGNLDADSEFKIEGGRIKASNKLALHQFEVEPSKPKQKQKSTEASNDDAAPASGGTAIPLDLALALLRDSENRIQLDLPVEGDLDDPNFDASDAIGQAVGSAATTGALLFLQPFGTLAIAGKLALSQASLVSFEPATFGAGSDRLTDKQREYLAALAEKLKARPGLRIKACGISTAQDVDALKPAGPSAEQIARLKAAGKPVPKPAVSDDALEELASQRRKRVRDYLIKDQGVANGQLVACAARIARDDSTDPRVELGM